MSRPARLAIITGRHGRGTNMVAIAEAAHRHEIDAEVVLVTSQNPQALSLKRAAELHLPYAMENDLSKQLHAAQPDIICLAGYMKLIPKELIEEYPRRILNVHPSLLPKFGGRGMYALNVQEAVLAAGDTVTGCTVHYVDPEYDHGDIILQRTCPVLPGDTPESLAERVLDEEHVAFPEAIRMVIAEMGLGSAKLAEA